MPTLPSGAYVSRPFQAMKMVYGLSGQRHLIGTPIDEDLTLMAMDAPEALPTGSMRRHIRNNVYDDSLIVESVTWRSWAC
jgi:hypothetical protein